MKKMVLLLVLAVGAFVGLAVMDSERNQSIVQESVFFSSEPTVIWDETNSPIGLVRCNKSLFPPNKGCWENFKLMIRILFWQPESPDKEKEKDSLSVPTDEEKMDPPQQTTA
jgi:hypothetical protein